MMEQTPQKIIYQAEDFEFELPKLEYDIEGLQSYLLIASPNNHSNANSTITNTPSKSNNNNNNNLLSPIKSPIYNKLRNAAEHFTTPPSILRKRKRKSSANVATTPSKIIATPSKLLSTPTRSTINNTNNFLSPSTNNNNSSTTVNADNIPFSPSDFFEHAQNNALNRDHDVIIPTSNLKPQRLSLDNPTSVTTTTTTTTTTSAAAKSPAGSIQVIKV